MLSSVSMFHFLDKALGAINHTNVLFVTDGKIHRVGGRALGWIILTLKYWHNGRETGLLCLDSKGQV